MSVPGLVVVQPGFPLRGVEGFLDGPTILRPGERIGQLRRTNAVLVALCWTGVLAPSSRNPLPRRGVYASEVSTTPVAPTG